MKYNNVIEYNPTNLAVALKEPEYFIIGRCLSGSRHYSEALKFYDLFEMVKKYIGVVDYFGGGTVEVYKEDGTLVLSKAVMDFDF